MSCSTRPCHQVCSPLPMWWLSTCTGERSSAFSPMKIRSKILIAGAHIPLGARSCGLILAQWIWNLRLELGHALHPTPMRTTEFALARADESAPFVEPTGVCKPTPQMKYGPPQWARPSFTGGFPGSAFLPQPDGTLRCPADHPRYPQERRPERDGSVRVLYAARLGHCRSCPLRAHCQESSTTLKPRRVSAVFWPLNTSRSDSSPPQAEAPPQLSLAPVFWRDWPRCGIRRTWLKVVRSQAVRVESSISPDPSPAPVQVSPTVTRAKRAHWRLSWEERLARNARPSDAPRLVVTLHGLPATFAHSFGFDLLAAA